MSVTDMRGVKALRFSNTRQSEEDAEMLEIIIVAIVALEIAKDVCKIYFYGKV